MRGSDGGRLPPNCGLPPIGRYVAGAGELIQAAASMQHPFAADLRQLAALAISKGWRKHEVARGIVSLAENYKLAVEANRETERVIKRAWREPD